MYQQRVKFIKELGRGSFGVTYLAYDKQLHKKVAVKTISIDSTSREGTSNLETINAEIDSIKTLSRVPKCHKYIACYIDSFKDAFKNSATIFIISEYVDGGPLTTYIQEHNSKIYPTILWPLYYQLLLGLKFIHNNGFAHRDIKPNNILLTSDLNIKYIDFGLACLSKCNYIQCPNKCENIVGTTFYQPPEFFNGTFVNSFRASKAHDIWSLAIVFFEMANGDMTYPFDIYSKTGELFSEQMSNGDMTYPFDSYSKSEELLSEQMSNDYMTYPFDIYSKPGELLSEQQIETNIARAPSYFSEYLLDDGRTDSFINFLLINNWKLRPNVDKCLDLIKNYILAVPFIY
jgi:serine/threonine protein kinase